MAANEQRSEHLEPVRVAVIGLGYWGPNLVRNLKELPEAEVVAMCDIEHEAARAPGTTLPGHPSGGGCRGGTRRPEIEAVAIATPVGTHHGLARRALEAGKHVFVEKPLAGRSKRRPYRRGRATRGTGASCAGHTFLYSPPST